MANSNLVGGERAAPVPPGHGTRELGPSNTSDSGSDVAGRLSKRRPLKAGDGETDSDDVESDIRGAGPELGDIDLDSDTDAEGTGERAEVGSDHLVEAADIRPDRIVSDPSGGAEGEDQEGVGISRKR